MEGEDYRALTPLFSSNIKPYGVFTVDFDKSSFLRQHDPVYGILIKVVLLPQTAAMFLLVLNEKNANLEMVKAGLAEVYRGRPPKEWRRSNRK